MWKETYTHKSIHVQTPIPRPGTPNMSKETYLYVKSDVYI